ncbi:hypothetical protein K505DRAFT_297450 [Melanomma pulvis-pyrius CBS 109.77]|uniref:Stress-response A/B barrel domain-containing protein n=1 Tax=Melanomma pulvis-pyrius CBS 109.77 TaxID=1314802 RepID=A0A6A6XQX9_9PLEO|nr:hypothetical protein K505DRAFT_297450 [Melanomma pulvis-pyrius CBS 109.77]
MIFPKRATGTIVLILIFISFTALIKSRLNPIVWLTLAFVPKPAAVAPFTTHIVLFQFKEGTSPITIKEMTSKMFSLKKSCIHPSTRSPYIISIAGGKDISTEDSQNGITHAFILQFFSNEDRDYYVDEDPVHQDFKAAAASVLEKAQVIDFQDGVFTTSN